MDSGERSKFDSTARPGSVAYKTLGLVIGSAIIGSAVTVLFLRIAEGGAETFSTASLMGFFFMVVLATSATALALSAISLSRAAERTMNQKSREISEMQVQVATQAAKTMGLLEESALLVGEEIVKSVCERFDMFRDDIRTELPRREVIRTDVTEAVKQALSAIHVASSEKPVKERVEPSTAVVVEKPPPEKPEMSPEEAEEMADKKYGDFKDIVLLGIANYPGVIARKIGEGHYRTEGDELADGAFTIKHDSVAVCTFATGDVMESRFLGKTGDSFSDFLKSLFNELKKKHFTRVFFVFDGVLTNVSPYSKALNAFRSCIDAGTFAQFELFEGSPETVIPELTERVSQLMALEAEQEMDAPPLSFREQMLASGSEG
ncbi:hypothetical protein [Tichowtungia aerotolerans]|uniref:Uncharacterized protein n=1 Tax=Tichowtungia aerotolerans TaxID=2697043 RepID=A0A6P1MFN9_9BACT|nr:hypothetical protein [Tichowtungia aerotolerans]QHI70426.1 hypothetical protein GT409_13595 [Tichowtungia aerotolerans]